MSDAPSWDRVKHVFQDVREQPEHARAARLRDLCGSDGALQAEVESLLATHDHAGSFGERPGLELLHAMAVAAESGAASSVSHILRPGDRLSVYEIQSLAGAGGMGEVYKARDTRLDRTVAIKVLPSALAADRDRYQRFEREARAVARLDHPHIGALYDVGQYDGVYFLVLQYLEGETLASRLTRGPLTVVDVLRYAIEIADALAHAHRRGIVHRDLKPGNICLTKTGARLLDFGLAKWREVAPGGLVGRSGYANVPDSLTGEGMIVGTLHYMAPEQLEGKEIDARADLFAFGVVVYEMVTGQKAFDGRSSADVIAAILRTQPPSLSAQQPLTPPALGLIVATCLAKDPDERWQSAGDVARQLRWISEAGGASSTLAPALSRQGRRPVVGAAVAGVLAGSLIGGAAWRSLYARAHAGPPLQVTRSVASAMIPRQGATSEYPSLALSPDGTRLAYIASRGNTTQLYLRSLDEFDAKPIQGAEDVMSPFFSADSRWLGFWAAGKLKKIAVSGGAPQTICDSTMLLGATWGPDDTIVFAPDKTTGLFRVKATGGTPQALTTPDRGRHEKSHRFPHFLPGGKAVLFTITTTSMISFDEAQIAVVSLPSSGIRVLFEGGTSPRFVSTGHLLYVRSGSLVAVPFDARRLE